MTEKNLKLISYLYLIIPVIIFVISWTKLFFSIPITICLIIIFKLLYNQTKNDNQNISELKNIIPIFVIILLICITAGHGGLFYQSNDWDARNAIFRDLIQQNWPVYYEKSNSALTYYIGQWMVPSVFGKLAIFIANVTSSIFPNIFTSIMKKLSLEFAFKLGNIGLLFWNSLGVLIVILWLIKILKLEKRKDIYLAIFIFLFFSGLDIIGMTIFGTFNVFLRRIHLEWWAITYQFSSMITQLFWVFNQSIPAWIITLIFLEEKSVKNYMLLILLALPFSPLPFIGLIILFACNGIRFLIVSVKNKKAVNFIKDIFSIQNVLAFFTILPLYACLYFGNSSATGNKDGGGFLLMTDLLTPFELIKLLIFWFIEVGIYGIFLIKRHRKNPLFYVIMIALLIIPLFKLGYEYDFSMRVSIPLLLVINVWIVQKYLEEKNKNNITISFILLTIVLSIGFVTPMCEYARAFYYINKTKKINLVCDITKTFSELDEIGANFVTQNPKENSIFFKYIAK